jgi:tRNA(His) 5'-end guanylyltransferase
MNDNLGDRCKAYENAFNGILPNRIPKILRLDGRAFHTVLRNVEKPYDKNIINYMEQSAIKVMEDIGGVARFAYIQSDECSIAINDFIDIDTQGWFGNRINKILSIASSIMSVSFSKLFDKDVYFDSRIFCVPETDINNAFYWRQLDATRNSIQQYARSMFSQKEVHKKNSNELQEMMHANHGFNWNDSPTWTKRGIVIYRNSENKLQSDYEIPQFNTDKEYLISKFIKERE